MNTNSELYLKAALYYRLRVLNYFELEGFATYFGNQRYFFRGGATPFNNGSAIDISRNKYCMNKVLEAAGIPVPKATGLTREEFESGQFSLEGLQFPVVAKPTADTGLGTDVLCNIKDEKTLMDYLAKCFKKYKIMSIEEFHGGLTCYRVLVLYGKVIGVVERRSANVTGDGKSTIQQLVDKANEKRSTQKSQTTMQLINIDQEVKICLDEQGITLDTVPKKGENVMLCYTANSSRGGSIKAIGKKVHKDTAAMLSVATKLLGLNYAGIDIVCEDINQPFKPGRGVIVETNHNPDITIHEHPLEGKPTHVARTMMRKLIRRHWCRYLYQLLYLDKLLSNLFVRVGILVALFFLIKHFV